MFVINVYVCQHFPRDVISCASPFSQSQETPQPQLALRLTPVLDFVDPPSPVAPPIVQKIWPYASSASTLACAIVNPGHLRFPITTDHLRVFDIAMRANGTYFFLFFFWVETSYNLYFDKNPYSCRHCICHLYSLPHVRVSLHKTCFFFIFAAVSRPLNAFVNESFLLHNRRQYGSLHYIQTAGLEGTLKDFMQIAHQYCTTAFRAMCTAIGKNADDFELADEIENLSVLQTSPLSDLVAADDSKYSSLPHVDGATIQAVLYLTNGAPSSKVLDNNRMAYLQERADKLLSTEAHCFGSTSDFDHHKSIRSKDLGLQGTPAEVDQWWNLIKVLLVPKQELEPCMVDAIPSTYPGDTFFSIGFVPHQLPRFAAPMSQETQWFYNLEPNELVYRVSVFFTLHVKHLPKYRHCITIPGFVAAEKFGRAELMLRRLLEVRKDQVLAMYPLSDDDDSPCQFFAKFYNCAANQNVQYIVKNWFGKE